MQISKYITTIEALGSVWQCTIWDAITRREFDMLHNETIQQLRNFEDTYSRFKKNTLIEQFALRSGIFAVPKQCTQMLTLYKDLHALTNGLFTPLIGGMLEDLGYNKEYTFKPIQTIQPLDNMQSVLTIIDDTHIQLTKKVRLDFGGLGKGYMVDILRSFYEEKGLQHFLINASGDMTYKGKEPLYVGLENPLDTSMVIGQVSIINNVCSSANNKRTWGNYGHTINPLTIQTPTDIIATWVSADTTMLADALCTCLFFTSPHVLKEKYSFEYCILHSNMSVEYSKNFKGEFYS